MNLRGEGRCPSPFLLFFDQTETAVNIKTPIRTPLILNEEALILSTVKTITCIGMPMARIANGKLQELWPNATTFADLTLRLGRGLETLGLKLSDLQRTLYVYEARC